MEQPPDIGRSVLHVNSSTHVWKDEQEIELSDLKANNQLLINFASEQPNLPAFCSDVWIVSATELLSKAN